MNYFSACLCRIIIVAVLGEEVIVVVGHRLFQGSVFSEDTKIKKNNESILQSLINSYDKL